MLEHSKAFSGIAVTRPGGVPAVLRRGPRAAGRGLRHGDAGPAARAGTGRSCSTPSPTTSRPATPSSTSPSTTSSRPSTRSPGAACASSTTRAPRSRPTRRASSGAAARSSRGSPTPRERPVGHRGTRPGRLSVSATVWFHARIAGTPRSWSSTHSAPASSRRLRPEAGVLAQPRRGEDAQQVAVGDQGDVAACAAAPRPGPAPATHGRRPPRPSPRGCRPARRRRRTPSRSGRRGSRGSPRSCAPRSRRSPTRRGRRRARVEPGQLGRAPGAGQRRGEHEREVEAASAAAERAGRPARRRGSAGRRCARCAGRCGSTRSRRGGRGRDGRSARLLETCAPLSHPGARMSRMPSYVAFLRAVNVGGRFVKMADRMPLPSSTRGTRRGSGFECSAARSSPSSRSPSTRPPSPTPASSGSRGGPPPGATSRWSAPSTRDGVPDGTAGAGDRRHRASATAA